MSGNEKQHSNEDHIRVVVRSRPLSAQEKAAQAPVMVTCDDERRQVQVAMPHSSKRTKKSYNFDMVFGQHASQANLYDAAIRPIVNEVLHGFNCTVFAYGQTGTGKTYTMEGDYNDKEGMGVIPRAVHTIFDQLGNPDTSENANLQNEYSVKVSFLELYNEELQDLLSVTDDKRLRVIEDKSKLGKGVTCHNLEEVIVKNAQDIFEIMNKALAKRRVGETELNHASSRSHCIFTLTVHIKETTPEGEDLLKVGKLNLVDLAGSECVGRSGAKNERAREAGNINQSLLTLGRVIQALVEKRPHVPYRDSKLTRLLQESLGGRTKTCIIATVAPSVQCLDETISTLDYAARAKTIKNRPEINQKMTKRVLIKEYDVEIQKLRKDLAAARAKDGVYLAEDRYNEIIQDLTSKTNQVEEFEAVLESRAKELEELQGLFESTQETLNQTSEQLKSTQENLESTKVVLSDTKVRLADEVEEKKKVTHIMRSHQATELQLQAKTKELHGFIDDMKADVGNLHSKIDRKNNVEISNKKHAADFRVCQEGNLQDLTNHVTSFRSEHQEKLENLSSNLKSEENAAKERYQVLAGVLQGLEELVNTSSSQVKSSCDQDISQVESLFQGVKDNVTDNIIGDSANNIQASLQKIQDVIGGLKETLLQQHDESLVWLSTMRETFEDTSASTSKFVKEQTEALIQTSQELEELKRERDQIATESDQKLSLRLEQERTRSELAKTKFLEEVASAFNKFHDSSMSSFTNMVDDERETRHVDFERLNNLQNKASETVESTEIKATTWLMESAKVWKQTEEDMKEQTKTWESQRHNGEHLLVQSQSDLQSLSERVELEKTNGIKSAEESLENSKSEVVGHIKQKASDDLATWEKCSESLARGNVLLEDAQEHMTGELCGQQHTGLEELGSMTTQAVDGVVHRAHEMTHQVVQLVDEDLVDDVPSGQTPSKKSYGFSRHIPTTSPHHRLLEQFAMAAEDGSLGDLVENYTVCDSETESIVEPEVSESMSSTDMAEKVEDVDQGQCYESVDESMSPTSNKSIVDTPVDSQLVSSYAESDASHSPRLSHDSVDSNDCDKENDSGNLFLERLATRTNVTKRGSKGVLASHPENQEEKNELEKDTVLGLKVTQLRDELSARGLSLVGNKSILQERLLNSL